MQVIEFETRFLLPFLFDHKSIELLLGHIGRVELMQTQFWQRQGLPKEYTDNLLPFLSLYRDQGNPNEFGAYCRGDRRIEKELFHSSSANQPWSGLQLVRRLGAELFLSPYGTGVLSLACTTDEPLTLSQIRQFNHALHLGTDWLAQDPARIIPLETELLDPQAGIEHLPGLCNVLLGGAAPGQPLADEYGVTSVQRSLSIYTVVRLSDDCDFGELSNRELLASDLLGLQAIWPAHHCGTSLDAIEPRQALLLNRRHWSATGHLGAAHLVSDQPTADGAEAQAFNPRRLTGACDKMFLQYLYALTQRLALQAFSREAMNRCHAGKCDEPDEFHARLSPLRQTLQHYGLRAYAFQLSEEDTSSRYYRYCQQALGIDEAVSRLDGLLTDIDIQLSAKQAIRVAEQTAHSIEEQNKLREKVEWIEVLIVTVYAVELAHHLGNAFAPESALVHTLLYPGVTLVLVGCVTMWSMISALQLWPKPPTEKERQLPNVASALVQSGIEWLQWMGTYLVDGKRRWAILWICAVITVHVAIGVLHQKGH